MAKRNDVNTTGFQEWVLDVTKGVSKGTACFIPVGKDGSLVFGMNVIGHCPGKLVGLVHMVGEKALEQWVKKNPDWQNKKFTGNCPACGGQGSLALEGTHFRADCGHCDGTGKANAESEVRSE